MTAPAGPAVSAPRTVAWRWDETTGGYSYTSHEPADERWEPLVTLADADAAVTAAVQDAERRIATLLRFLDAPDAFADLRGQEMVAGILATRGQWPTEAFGRAQPHDEFADYVASLPRSAALEAER